MCRCAYPQEIFSLNYALFDHRNLTKMKDTTETLHWIAWNSVVMKNIMCRYAFLQEMLIWSFCGAIYIQFFVRLPVTNAWNCHLYRILKQCWSVGYVSLLTLSFILNQLQMFGGRYFKTFWFLWKVAKNEIQVKTTILYRNNEGTKSPVYRVQGRFIFLFVNET